MTEDPMSETEMREARMRDAHSTSGNANAIALIERMVNEGRPLPTTAPNSFYLYADDYFRHKHHAPLRVRAAGQYYLDDDRYPTERTLPFVSMPLTRVAGGYQPTADDA